MQGVLLLLLSSLILAASNELWIAVENRLESSVEKSNTISVPSVKHIIGLSSPSHAPSSLPDVFATILSARGPAVYRLGGHGQVLLARGQYTGPRTSSYFEDIAHDSSHSMLYMTSKFSHSIFRMEAREGANIQTFIHNGDKKPSGIAYDFCSGRIYWTNSDRRRPTIETFLPFSSNHSISLLSSNLTRPRAITVDPLDRRLYWSDTDRDQYRIESVRLDGSDRVLLVQGDSREPFSLSVDSEYVYWSDWTTRSVWRYSKSWTGSTRTPQLVHSFPHSKPHGITSLSVSQPTCGPTESYFNLDFVSMTTSPPTVAQDSRTDASVTKVLTDAPVTKAVTDAPAAEVQTDAPVAEGFKTNAAITTISSTAVSAKESSVTEVPVSKILVTVDSCHNFCLADGICHLESGVPVCECEEGRTGLRCEEDSCHNYCLGEASCVVIESVPECLCSPGLEGDRCQYNVTQSSSGFPLTSISSVGSLQVIVFSLAAVTGILTVLLIVLSVIVCRMRKKPRVVRKRFISVARGENERKGPRSQCGLPVEDGITLDIDNCCNMTLCDTPCFEPPTRRPRKSSSRSKTGNCEDRKTLLDAEEREEEEEGDHGDQGDEGRNF